MTLNDLTNVTERYINSKNEDFKRDFNAIAKLIDDFTPTSEEVDAWLKLKKKVSNHFLSLITTKGLLVKDIIQPTDFTKNGWSLLQEWLYSNTEDAEKKMDEINTLMVNADTSSVVVILSMLKSVKLKKAKVLQSLGKTEQIEALFQPPTVDGELPSYLKSSIEELKNTHHTDKEHLRNHYLELAHNTATRINEDTDFNSKQEKQKAFSNLSDEYKRKLMVFEMEEKDFSQQHPKYGDNANLYNKLTTELIKCTNNKQAIELLGTYSDFINYREHFFKMSEREALTTIQKWKELANILQDESVKIQEVISAFTNQR